MVPRKPCESACTLREQQQVRGLACGEAEPIHGGGEEVQRRRIGPQAVHRAGLGQIHRGGHACGAASEQIQFGRAESAVQQGIQRVSLGLHAEHPGRQRQRQLFGVGGALQSIQRDRAERLGKRLQQALHPHDQAVS
jgi:hypothetical protein